MAPSAPHPPLTQKSIPTPAEIHLRMAFVVLHAISLASFILLLVFIHYWKLKRHRILKNMFAAFAVTDIWNLLIARYPLHPSWNLCLVSQAGACMGTTLVASGVCSLVLYTWSLLQTRAGHRVLDDRYLVPALLWLPWVLGSAVFLLSIISTSLRPSDLEFELLTCYANNVFTDAGHYLAIVAILATLFFESWSFVLVIKNLRAARRRSVLPFAVGDNTEPIAVAASQAFSNTFTIKVLLFGLAVLAGFGALIGIVSYPSSHAPGIFQASTGIIAVSLFGPQKDVIEAVRSSFSYSNRRSVYASRANPFNPTLPAKPRLATTRSISPEDRSITFMEMLQDDINTGAVATIQDEIQPDSKGGASSGAVSLEAEKKAEEDSSDSDTDLEELGGGVVIATLGMSKKDGQKRVVAKDVGVEEESEEDKAPDI